MSYRGLGQTQGVSFPPGYSLAGNCDAAGNPTGYATDTYLILTPTGTQCLTTAQMLANWPATPAQLSTPMANPITVPAGYVPPAATGAKSFPVATGGPVMCTTPQCLADMAALNAGAGSGSAAIAASNPLGSMMAWIQANPLLAAAIGLGAVLVLTKL